ncbi:MAG: hypothetical protein K6F86_09650 [Lachnospiraceae bacterium]|nr:hypothetical protein [Lachnospiraceae bacterium]
MSYNYCKDHRSGITYVYEMEKSIDGSTGEIKTVRRLVGKLDEEGNVVPTSGRRGRLPKKQTSGNIKGVDAREVKRLKEENEDLRNTVTALQKSQKEIIKGLESLLALAGQQVPRKRVGKARR